MNTPKTLQDDRPYSRQLADFLIVGLDRLGRMAASHTPIVFADWVSLTTMDLGLQDIKVSEDKLLWLWNALRCEPGVVHTHGPLPPAQTSKWDKSKRLPVLDRGGRFVIGMKPAEVQGLLGRVNYSTTTEPVSVQLLGQLQMRPGKAGRLECCRVKAEVTIHAKPVYSASREADIMRIPEDDITIGEESVKVRVKSLNQAYTIASRRLEPNRLSHGGRVYDHLIYLRPGGPRILLETIRQRVEAGDWPVSETIAIKQPAEHVEMKQGYEGKEDS